MALINHCEKRVDLDLDAPARDLLAAEMVARPSAGRWAAVRMFAEATFLAMSGGTASPIPVSGFLVITRRDTGATLLRTKSNTTDAALLAHVQRQLDELTVGEFLDRWGIDAGALEDGSSSETTDLR